MDERSFAYFTQLKIGGKKLVKWALNSPPACVHKKIKMGVSNFGVLAQIWSVGPNFKIQSNIIFNVAKENVHLLGLLWQLWSYSRGEPILDILGSWLDFDWTRESTREQMETQFWKILLNCSCRMSWLDFDSTREYSREQMEHNLWFSSTTPNLNRLSRLFLKCRYSSILLLLV